MNRVTLVDYGVGNLRSVEKALQAAGAQVRLSSDPGEILSAEKIVLPGVGAFGDGMNGLHAQGLVDALRAAAGDGKPILGICLGMQLLFEASEEMGAHTGLGLLPGIVRRFPNNDLKIPHTGWNQLWFARSPLLSGLEPGCYVYFNHSYYCQPADAAHRLAETEYGLRYAGMIGRDRLYGVQFHPEKSQTVGLQILRNFVEQG